MTSSRRGRKPGLRPSLKSAQSVSTRGASSNKKHPNELAFNPSDLIRSMMTACETAKFKVTEAGAFGLGHLLEHLTQTLIDSAKGVLDCSSDNEETIMPEHLLQGIQPDQKFNGRLYQIFLNTKLKEQIGDLIREWNENTLCGPKVPAQKGEDSTSRARTGAEEGPAMRARTESKPTKRSQARRVGTRLRQAERLAVRPVLENYAVEYRKKLEKTHRTFPDKRIS